MKLFDRLKRPVVGVTPCDVVFTDNKLRLLHYVPKAPKHRTPVLLIPSLT